MPGALRSRFSFAGEAGRRACWGSVAGVPRCAFCTDCRACFGSPAPQATIPPYGFPRPKDIDRKPTRNRLGLAAVGPLPPARQPAHRLPIADPLGSAGPYPHRFPRYIHPARRLVRLLGQCPPRVGRAPCPPPPQTQDPPLAHRLPAGPAAHPHRRHPHLPLATRPGMRRQPGPAQGRRLGRADPRLRQQRLSSRLPRPSALMPPRPPSFSVPSPRSRPFIIAESVLFLSFLRVSASPRPRVSVSPCQPFLPPVVLPTVVVTINH
jgi:hypothetical protein